MSTVWSVRFQKNDAWDALSSAFLGRKTEIRHALVNFFHIHFNFAVEIPRHLV